MEDQHSTSQKTLVAHELLDSEWNGRYGFNTYYIPLADKERVRAYIREHIQFRPPCGDRIESIKLVTQGEKIRKETRNNMPRKFLVPTKGSVVKIIKRSCS